MQRIGLIKKSIIIELSILCMSIYIFFNCTSTILNYLMLAIALLLAIVTLFEKGRKIKVGNKVSAIFVFILIYSLASLFGLIFIYSCNLHIDTDNCT
jgi:hypothetical protein